MRKVITVFTFFLAVVACNAQAIYNKVGGVCFRMDDHQPAYKWRSLDSLFNKYGYKFSLALNPERILTDTAAYHALQEVVTHGHELMEHTPSHTTAYIAFSTANKKDTLWYAGKPGIDHINASSGRICLKIDTLYTQNYTGEGLVNVYGNTIISVANGEFKDLSSPVNYSNLYIPARNFVATWSNLLNKNPNDPDTLTIQSYWQEAVKLDTVLGVAYERLTGNDIKMEDDALKLLVARSFYIYDSLGLPRPKSWIQPGGSFAQLSKDDVKNILVPQFGFTAAATYLLPAYKMYNEVDTLHNKRFAIQNPDFSEENNSYQTMINTISDNSARHINSFTLSHISTNAIGWTAYIERLDSVLTWCRDNNIPVRTFNQWASILFDSVPNPYANVVPELYRDLNNNGLPDGLTMGSGTTDSLNGVAQSQNISLHRTASGTYFSINNLGGFEKGWNRLSLFTKGPGAKDSVRIGIGHPEIPSSQKYYNLAANTPDWQEVSTMVYLDPKATRMSFQVIASRNVSVGNIGISGVQLRKLSRIYMQQGFTTHITTDKFFRDISTGEFIIDSLYKNNEYKIAVTQGHSVSVTVDSANGKIAVMKPTLFWVGTDSVKVVATNSDKTSDSGYIYFSAAYPSVCEGESITLRGSAAFGTGYAWYDGTTVVAADSIVVSPTAPAWYRVEYTDVNSLPVTDSIFIGIDAVKPQITFTNDTTLCAGTAIIFTLPDAGTVKWLDEDGALLGHGALVLQATHTQTIYIENNINACVTRDTVAVTVLPTNIISQHRVVKQTLKGKSTGFNVTVPVGAKIVLLNTPANTFIYQPDSVIFTPGAGFLGADSAIYLITDSICAYDTLVLRVNVVLNTAVSDIAPGSINIYPNPATHELFVNTELAATLHIYSTVGSRVATHPIAPGENRVDIAGLASGVYLLKIETAHGILSSVLIKE